MKIAILSDIHGNSLALDAVLSDLKKEEIDGYWILGDLVALGPDPVGVLERIMNSCKLQCYPRKYRPVCLCRRPAAVPYIEDLESESDSAKVRRDER